jgi:hypothetical protein
MHQGADRSAVALRAMAGQVGKVVVLSIQGGMRAFIGGLQRSHGHLDAFLRWVQAISSIDQVWSATALM